MTYEVLKPYYTYPQIINGRDAQQSMGLYGNNPRSFNLFDQRADNFLRDTDWLAFSVQGGTGPNGYENDCVDGVVRLNYSTTYTLGQTNHLDIGLPAGNANFYADGIPGWIDYNEAENYFRFTCSRGHAYIASAARTQANTSLLPLLVPLRETFTFRIPEEFPFDTLHYTHSPYHVPTTHECRNQDAVIWEKKHLTGSAFMSMYLSNRSDDSPVLYLTMGAPTSVAVLDLDPEPGVWHTLILDYMLGSYEYNTVYGTFDGVPFEYTFTGRAVMGQDSHIALAQNGILAGAGPYSYYYNPTSTFFGVHDNLPMNDPVNSPTKTLDIRQWKFETASSVAALKPVLPRSPRV